MGFQPLGEGFISGLGGSCFQNLGSQFSPLNSAVAATITFTDSSVDGTAGPAYTFSSQAIGTAAASRRIIVGAFGRSNAAVTLTSITVGGVTATVVASATDNDGIVFLRSDLAIVDFPAGTSASIVVTYSSAGSLARASIGVWAAYDLLSATPTDTANNNSDPMSAAIDVSAGGIIVGFATSDATATHTWTNLTERFDEAVEGISSHTGASDAFAAGETNRTITADPSAATTNQTLVLGAWR
jgi:hypothetical protein